jgi:hypothetical protein
MEASEYELIIYIGIAEDSQDLKSYIEMEQLKALDKHINKSMFYTKLNRSIEAISSKFNNRLQRDLIIFNRQMEDERQAPEGQKFGYSTELPTIYNFGFPLLSLTKGKYTGDVYFNHIEAFAKAIEETNQPTQQRETKTKQEIPKTFEELFYNPENAEPCLKILSDIQPPVIDAINNYIGKAKGVFPLWVRVLKNHKPEPLIKHFKDDIYKDLLNQKVKGLNLSKDASEFRKEYKRIKKDKIELDIKTILSQYSQRGKLGK